jgi:serine/threonine-protein kinase
LLDTQRMIGERLGTWVIFKELGRGGMGRVYLAQEELTGRKAAIKVLAAELAQEGGFLQRFQREIETLSRLEHRHIVRFYESGLENGHYFYAMEYVEGQNLEEMIAKQGKLDWRDVMSVALQVAPALKHCHDHGVIHRDLKPSNLIVDAKGEIKITDFGIAKVFAQTHLTATGGIVGTAEYLSPEQAAGKVVGKRSDLYCLGCVLYALLCGRPPFVGNSYVELLQKHRYAQFDRPRAYVPDVPYEVDEMICELLEKDPDKRPSDAHVLQNKLKSIARKLEQHGARTSVDNNNQPTRADNRADLESIPGPATVMSRLVRAELDEQQQGGTLSRFFNRPLVLVAILLACIGFLTYKLWPLNQDQLFQRGAQLMESEREYDMQKAWTEYLGPLEQNYPEHPYKEKVEEFRQRWNAAKAPSEAQRFFQQGELLAKQGNVAAARKTWHSLIDVFAEMDGEKLWVERARRALADMDKEDANQDRFRNVRAALEKADALQRDGKHAQAERIWAGIEQLYRNDPAAEGILAQVQKARQKS